MSYLAKLINQLLYLTYFFVFFYHKIRNLYLLRSNKLDLNNNKNNKLIIRNDRLGDSILTLPFILGIKKNQETILISKYIFSLLDQLKIDYSNLISPEMADYRKITYGINLPGYNLNNIKQFKKLNKSNIFTQVGFRNFKNKGIPLFFSPNFGSIIS